MERGPEGWALLMLKINLWLSRKATMFYGQGADSGEWGSHAPTVTDPQQESLSPNPKQSIRQQIAKEHYCY